MAETNVQLVISAKDEASKTLNKVRGELQGLADSPGFGLIAKGAKAAAVGVAALGAAITTAGAFAVKSAADYEQQRIAFEGMLGSAERAKKLLKEITLFSKETPFDLPQVVEGARRLLAYNVEAEKIIPTFKMLGDISAVVGKEKLPQLIMAFGQVKAATKLTGAELRQFSESGIPLLEALVKQANAAGGQMKEMGEDSDKVAKKIKTLTEKIADQEFRLKLMTEGNKQNTDSYKILARQIEQNKNKLAEYGEAGTKHYERVKVTAADMIETISDGGVTFAEVEKALLEMTKEGGIAHDAMAKQAKSFQGIFSNIKESVGTMAREIIGITTEGDIREGSIFYYLKKGGERLYEWLSTHQDSIITSIQGMVQSFVEVGNWIIEARDKVKSFFTDTNYLWVFLKDMFSPMIRDLKEIFVETWDVIKKAIEPIRPEIEMMAKVFGVILLAALVLIGETFVVVIKSISLLIEGLVLVISGMVQAVEYGFETIFSLFNNFGEKWDWLKDNFIGGAKMIKEGFENAMFKLGDIIFSPIESGWNKVKDFFSNIADKLFSPIKDAWNVVKDAISNPVDFFTDKFKKFIDFINESIKKVNKLPGINIPEIRYALGGAVMAGRPIIVGENRPEVFVPSQSGNIKQLDQVGGKTVTVNFNNVSVRSDNDLQSIIDAVKATLSREEKFSRMGLTT